MKVASMANVFDEVKEMAVLATAEENFQVCLEALRWLFRKLTDRVAIQKFSIDLLPNRRRSLSQPSTL